MTSPQVAEGESNEIALCRLSLEGHTFPEGALSQYAQVNLGGDFHGRFEQVAPVDHVIVV